MLELDVLLGPFVEEAFHLLDDDKKLVFERLLTCDDPDLFAWFMGHASCPQPDLDWMVQHILARVKV